MIDALQMMYQIKTTLEKMGLKFASHEAMMLVYRTGLVESKYKYLTQKGSDIARGFWQCEPWVAVSLCNDYLKYRSLFWNGKRTYVSGGDGLGEGFEIMINGWRDASRREWEDAVCFIAPRRRRHH